MPFTFSHPAIVLPFIYLNKKWFSLTGLIIGSMVPDFEYFLRMRIKSNYSHTLEGLFWFDLPLAILLAFLFHNIVRNSLFSNLPYCLKTRFCDFTKFNWNNYFRNNWLIVIISILIGAATHLFWDSFTHGEGYFVDIIPALKQNIHILEWQIPLLKILQHGSSIIGGLIIIYVIYKMPINGSVKRTINYRYWIVILSLAIVILTIRILIEIDLKYGNIIVSGISAVLLSFTITPFFIRTYWFKR